MKNITLSADESLIEAARAKARAEQTTLNEQFRRWLAAYAHANERMDRYDAVMAELAAAGEPIVILDGEADLDVVTQAIVDAVAAL